MIDARRTILVADDVPENLAIIGDLLHPEFQVRVADSGARTLELARILPLPDLVLLDVMMPGMDGYTVLAELKADAATRGFTTRPIPASSSRAILG